MNDLKYPVYQKRDLSQRTALLRGLDERTFPGAAGVMDSLRAALWLLASKDFEGQALVLLYQAAEVTMKGILGPEAVKTCERWRRRPQGDACLMKVIFDAVHTRRALSAVGPRQMTAFADFRNDIVHGGSKKKALMNYRDVILKTAIPLLKELYHKAYGFDIERFLGRPLARELDVARQYLVHVKKRGIPHFDRVLEPYRLRLRYDAKLGRFPIDHIRDNAEDAAAENDEPVASMTAVYLDTALVEQRDEAERDGWRLYTHVSDSFQCLVCGEQCIVGLGETKQHDAQAYDEPAALACPFCGLHLGPEYAELVRLHFGPITRERCGVDPALWAERFAQREDV